MNISSKSTKRGLLSTVIVSSIALHIVGALVLGTFKIVEALRPSEKAFEAPPIVEQIEQEPIFEEVNLEQRNRSSAPPRPTPIVVKTPDVSLPSLNIEVNVQNSSTFGRGSVGGLGSGTASIRELSLALTDFGYTGFVEGTLEGTLIDLKRNPDGRAIDTISNENTQRAVLDFTGGNWDLGPLEQTYYTAEQKLYASNWLLGRESNILEAFNVSGKMDPGHLMVLYSGSYRPEKSSRMRFVGLGDRFIVVRIDGKIVFDGSYSRNKFTSGEPNSSTIGGDLLDFNRSMYAGQWIKLSANRSHYMEVLIGTTGKNIGYFLLQQEENDPAVKVFSTKSLTDEEKNLVSAIHEDVPLLLNEGYVKKRGKNSN